MREPQLIRVCGTASGTSSREPAGTFTDFASRLALGSRLPQMPQNVLAKRAAVDSS